MAVGPPVVALCVQAALWGTWIPEAVWFLPFYPAVFLSAWIGGLRAGAAAAVLGAALVWWSFVPPRFALLKSPEALLPFAIFLITSALIAVLVDRLKVSNGELQQVLGERKAALLQVASLIEQSPDGIFVADLEGRYTSVNERGCRMLGYSREELIGKTIRDLLSPTDIQRLQESKERLLKGDSEVGEWLLRRRDGGLLPVEVNARILPDGRWQASVRDISARREAEEALRRSQDRYELALAGADLGAWDWNVVTGEVVFNARWAEMRGFRLEEIKPHVDSWQDAVHPDDWRLVSAALAEHFDGRRPFYEAEHRVRTKAGEWLWVLDRGKVFTRDASGAPTRMLGTELDISARKAFEKTQRESNADLNRAQAVAQVGSWRLDINKNELHWSDEEYRIFGVLQGTPMTYEGFLACVHPDDRAFVDERWKAGLRGEPYDIEHRLLVSDRVKWVRNKADLEFDDQGRLLGGIGITHDVTVRRELEEELRRAIESRDLVLGIVAHDLRNPLNVIHLQAQLLRHPSAAADAQTMRAAEMIVRASGRMSRLIEDLLVVTRLAAGHLRIERAAVDVKGVLLDAVETQAPIAEAAEVALHTELRDALPTIWGDQARLAQILENLVGNAVKFTAKGGVITVGAAVADAAVPEVLVWVADTGAGIPPEELTRVFDRFWQGQDTLKRGAGLGLPIVKGLVEAHGGRIWVESTVGQGTTFYFTIPVARPQEQHPTESAALGER
ncbi:MAG: PAS domain-containing protein [Deltaproteobacteria bacterium]|nr:PAS domain-containing protein [Deltaproteobacteria bacterium]